MEQRILLMVVELEKIEKELHGLAEVDRDSAAPDGLFPVRHGSLAEVIPEVDDEILGVGEDRLGLGRTPVG